MLRVILGIIAVLTAFASACNPGDIGDGDVRFGGTGDPAAGEGGSPGPGEGDGGTDQPATDDDAFPQDDPSCPDVAAVNRPGNSGDSIT